MLSTVQDNSTQGSPCHYLHNTCLLFDCSARRADRGQIFPGLLSVCVILVVGLWLRGKPFGLQCKQFGSSRLSALMR